MRALLREALRSCDEQRMSKVITFLVVDGDVPTATITALLEHEAAVLSPEHTQFWIGTEVPGWGPLPPRRFRSSWL